MAGLTMDAIERSERVRAVTDNFFFWQGLRFVALGPVMMIVALATMAGVEEGIANALLVAAVVGATFASAAGGAIIWPSRRRSPRSAWRRWRRR
jgi:hypothetical protein